MTTTISRRISASALALVATAAIGLGGSTEAWGQTSAWEAHHHAGTSAKTSAWEAKHHAGTSAKTSAWEAHHTTTSSKTSAWE